MRERTCACGGFAPVAPHFRWPQTVAAWGLSATDLRRFASCRSRLCLHTHKHTIAERAHAWKLLPLLQRRRQAAHARAAGRLRGRRAAPPSLSQGSQPTSSAPCSCRNQLPAAGMAALPGAPRSCHRTVANSAAAATAPTARRLRSRSRRRAARRCLTQLRPPLAPPPSQGPPPAGAAAARGAAAAAPRARRRPPQAAAGAVAGGVPEGHVRGTTAVVLYWHSTNPGGALRAAARR
jgi:hypothetical protein